VTRNICRPDWPDCPGVTFPAHVFGLISRRCVRCDASDPAIVGEPPFEPRPPVLGGDL
jgi:hypothetical protein